MAQVIAGRQVDPAQQGFLVQERNPLVQDLRPGQSGFVEILLFGHQFVGQASVIPQAVQVVKNVHERRSLLFRPPLENRFLHHLGDESVPDEPARDRVADLGDAAKFFKRRPESGFGVVDNGVPVPGVGGVAPGLGEEPPARHRVFGFLGLRGYRQRDGENRQQDRRPQRNRAGSARRPHPKIGAEATFANHHSEPSMLLTAENAVAVADSYGLLIGSPTPTVSDLSAGGVSNAVSSSNPNQYAWYSNSLWPGCGYRPNGASTGSGYFAKPKGCGYGKVWWRATPYRPCISLTKPITFWQ